MVGRMQPPAHPQAPAAAPRASDVTVTVTNARILAPDTVRAGYARLRLRNRSDSVTAHGLVRLRDGVPVADGVRAVRVMWRLERGDARAARAKLAGFYGGAVFVAPHAERAVGVVLPPGDYVTYVDVITRGGPRVPEAFVRPLHVRAAPGAARVAPAARPADVVVRMADMRFDMPARVSAGPLRWRFENAGASDHLAFVTRLRPGRTFDEARVWLATHRGPRPLENDARTVGVHALSGGVANDVVLDLAPGEYVVACLIGGHHRAGMVRRLTVEAPARAARRAAGVAAPGVR
jgi:hypothetical protein